MAAKLDKVEVYSKGPLSLVMLWSRYQVITWQMKNVISLLRQDLWPPNLTEWWVLMWTYYPSSHTQPVDHVFTEGYMTNVLNSLSRDLCLMIRSHTSNRKVTYPLITWLHEFARQKMNFVISSLSRGLLLLNLTG